MLHDVIKAIDGAEKLQHHANDDVISPTKEKSLGMFPSHDRKPYDDRNKMHRLGNLIVDEEEGRCDAAIGHFENHEEEASKGNLEESNVENDDEALHLLEGMPGCLELPSPEDIADDTLGESRDFIQKIEEIIGSYCSKCFYSKHWSLREAAAHESSLALLRSSQSKDDFLKQIPTICGILEKVFYDRIIQVRQHSNIEIYLRFVK